MAFAHNDKKSDYLPLTDQDCQIGSKVHFTGPDKYHQLAINKAWTVTNGDTPDLIGVVQIEEEEWTEIYTPSLTGTIVEREIIDTEESRFTYLLLEFEEGQLGYVIAYKPAARKE